MTAVLGAPHLTTVLAKQEQREALLVLLAATPIAVLVTTVPAEPPARAAAALAEPQAPEEQLAQVEALHAEPSQDPAPPNQVVVVVITPIARNMLGFQPHKRVSCNLLVRKMAIPGTLGDVSPVVPIILAVSQPFLVVFVPPAG
jgi:hypothetical protein